MTAVLSKRLIELVPNQIREPSDGRIVEQCQELLGNLLSPKAPKVSFQQWAGKWYSAFQNSLVFAVVESNQQDVLNVFLENPTLEWNQEFDEQRRFSNNEEKSSSMGHLFRQTIALDCLFGTFHDNIK